MGRRGRKGEAISLLTVCGYAPKEDCPTITAHGAKGRDDRVPRAEGPTAHFSLVGAGRDPILRPGVRHTFPRRLAISATWPQRQKRLLLYCGTRRNYYLPVLYSWSVLLAARLLSKYLSLSIIASNTVGPLQYVPFFSTLAPLRLGREALFPGGTTVAPRETVSSYHTILCRLLYLRSKHSDRDCFFLAGRTKQPAQAVWNPVAGRFSAS